MTYIGTAALECGDVSADASAAWAAARSSGQRHSTSLCIAPLLGEDAQASFGCLAQQYADIRCSPDHCADR